MVRDPGYYDGINSYWSNGMWQNLLMSGAQGLISGGIRSLFNKRERPVRGFEAGALQKQYFQGLYGDKLNPWEWSGSGGFGEGGASAPLMAGVQARKTQDQALNTQTALEQMRLGTELQKANIQKETQLETAKIGAEATVDAAKFGAGEFVSSYGTVADQKQKLTKSQEQLNDVKRQIGQSDLKLKNLDVKQRKDLFNHLVLATKAELEGKFGKGKFDSRYYGWKYKDPKNEEKYSKIGFLEKEFDILAQQFRIAKDNADMLDIAKKYHELTLRMGLQEQGMNMFRDFLFGITSGVGAYGLMRKFFPGRSPSGKYFPNARIMWPRSSSSPNMLPGSSQKFLGP